MAVASAATLPSWAKVLSQVGFGNGGSVPETNPDSRTAASDAAASARGAGTWAAYAADRPWVALSPARRWRRARHAGEMPFATTPRRVVLSGDTDAIEAGLRVVAGLSDEAKAA